VFHEISFAITEDEKSYFYLSIQINRCAVGPNVAGAGIAVWAHAAELGHHAPDGIEAGLNRALSPCGRPRNTVAR